MPTIFRTRRGYAVRIYPNDHRPPHVHVVGPGAEARFELLCDLGMVRLLDNHRFSLSQLSEIARELVARLDDLCDTWETLHG